MARAYIVDGNSLLFRAYYATAYAGSGELMRTKTGIPTNAVFAFGNMVDKILGGLKQGDYLFVGFDTGKKTFRHEEDKDYKANRKPAPQELKEQMPIARELLKSLNIFTYEKEGFEADDVCGTVARMFSKAGVKTTMYTSDRDFLQLIDDNVNVCLLKTGLSKMDLIDTSRMIADYGYAPRQIIDYKGLRGDASDNLPGIPGIGEKTAVKLIKEYGSLEKIIAAAPAMKGKLGENILRHQEEGRMCSRLATIVTDVALPFGLDSLVYEGYRFKAASAFANKYELKQFLSRLPEGYKLPEGGPRIELERIDSFKDISLPKDIGIALDMEEGNYNDVPVRGLALYDGRRHYYIDAEHLVKDEALRKVLESPEYRKYCHDFKAAKVALRHLGIGLAGLRFDMLLAAYLIDSSIKGSLAASMLCFGLDLGGNEGELSLLSPGDPLKAARIAHYALSEHERIESELSRRECLDLYLNVELPLADVLAGMEIEGVPLDVKELKKIGEGYAKKREDAREKVYAAAGHRFNLDSPKQVAEVLYGELQLAPGRKGSTASEFLKELAPENPIAQHILDYRKYAKLVSTYVEALAEHVYPDGKLHALFNQAQTATGRLSMSEPNLQNIAINDEEGKLIRKAFHYRDDDYEFLSLDYSQIELRILASLARSESFKKVFASGEDVHAATAKRLFGIEHATAGERRRAKAVNFGIIYGISDWGLAEEIGVSKKEAHAIIESFYEAYPEIGEYFRGVTEGLMKNGYVTTLFGRRRYLREVHDANYQVREFAKRAAMNAPIQGTAADLIKIAMIKVDEAIRKKGLESKLILQIHDELLLKVPPREKEIILPLVKEIMEKAIDLDVKLKADGGFGQSWYDAK